MNVTQRRCHHRAAAHTVVLHASQMMTRHLDHILRPSLHAHHCDRAVVCVETIDFFWLDYLIEMQIRQHQHRVADDALTLACGCSHLTGCIFAFSTCSTTSSVRLTCSNCVAIRAISLIALSRSRLTFSTSGHQTLLLSHRRDSSQTRSIVTDHRLCQFDTATSESTSDR
jgi:hypothetical protein